jgi:hypothetical protein
MHGGINRPVQPFVYIPFAIAAALLRMPALPYAAFHVLHAALLCAGGHEKLLRLFEVERPDAAPFELPGAPSTIKAAVFVGPSDSLLVSSTGDSAGLTVWDVRGGAVVRSMPTDGPVTSVDVSKLRDGQQYFENLLQTYILPVNACCMLFCPFRML